MAWFYNSKTGDFFKDDRRLCTGYSGQGECRNQPDTEWMVAKGPIPRGRYLIGQAHKSAKVGPVAMHLFPDGHDAHGRSALMIHGDNSRGDASTGCVILPRLVREWVRDDPDRRLVVYSGWKDQPPPVKPLKPVEAYNASTASERCEPQS